MFAYNSVPRGREVTSKSLPLPIPALCLMVFILLCLYCSGWKLQLKLRDKAPLVGDRDFHSMSTYSAVLVQWPGRVTVLCGPQRGTLVISLYPQESA
jgi:hypothetical protein